jgi:hypothetical protein
LSCLREAEGTVIETSGFARATLGTKSFAHVVYKVLNRHRLKLEGTHLGLTESCLQRHFDFPEEFSHPHELALSIDRTSISRPTMTYNQEKTTVNQVNIDECIVMGTYPWPNRREWPGEEPRYRGFDHAECSVCGHVLPVEKGRAGLKEVCQCTLADLCGARNWSPHVLVELVKYAGKGVGVRALQTFVPGEALGEYVGEIFPSHYRKRGSSKMKAT